MHRCRTPQPGWIAILGAATIWMGAHGQQLQFLPELDGHLTLNSNLRVYLQAKDDREGSDPHQFTFGPSLQLFHKPLLKLKRISAFDLDDLTSRPLVVESGYRIITAPDTPPKNRALEEVTFRLPISTLFSLTDRNRVDLEWQMGKFDWRYRNGVRLQRTVTIRKFHFIPYLVAEPFYKSQYGKWSATDLYAGSLLPTGKHAQIDCYYEHENDTGHHPNRQQNYIGLALHIYFSH